ncbi:hypothetical protein B0J12DRAFT_683075 [Macrophomina phaseolina]|uniref:Uncharacterized protein n=1 Tax=Macrophomina phaseolina TaxID=35725 RepID=A0ABQ8FV65_9PEZI|nr:hypothetical protein B0J12DRAFT_683075 [Macrophomina phaseolina]
MSVLDRGQYGLLRTYTAAIFSCFSFLFPSSAASALPCQPACKKNGLNRVSQASMEAEGAHEWMGLEDGGSDAQQAAHGETSIIVLVVQHGVGAWLARVLEACLSGDGKEGGVGGARSPEVECWDAGLPRDGQARGTMRT